MASYMMIDIFELSPEQIERLTERAETCYVESANKKLWEISESYLMVVARDLRQEMKVTNFKQAKAILEECNYKLIPVGGNHAQ